MVGVDGIKRLLTPIANRIKLLVGRCVLTVIADGGGLQLVQLKGLAGETLDARERFQEYGFTSVPLAGCEAVMVAVGGARNHAVVIACDDRRHRLKGLGDGDVAIYDDKGQKVHLSRGGVAISTPLNLTISAGGDIDVTAAGGFALNAARIDLN